MANIETLLYEACHDREVWHTAFKESEARRREVERERTALRAALQSIADSSCCTGCQEAALVAKAALKESHD